MFYIKQCITCIHLWTFNVIGMPWHLCENWGGKSTWFCIHGAYFHIDSMYTLYSWMQTSYRIMCYLSFTVHWYSNPTPCRTCWKAPSISPSKANGVGHELFMHASWSNNIATTTRKTKTNGAGRECDKYDPGIEEGLYEDKVGSKLVMQNTKEK